MIKKYKPFTPKSDKELDNKMIKEFYDLARRNRSRNTNTNCK